MKKILIIILLFVAIIAHSQISKYEIEYMNMKELDVASNSLGKWQGWNSQKNMIVELDKSNKTIEITGIHTQTFKITESKERKELFDRVIYIFIAYDDDFIRCILEIVYFPNKTIHMYLRWSNLEVLYQMEEI